MPTLIFIHGAPACGKLTIAKQLSDKLNESGTQFKLFHNHLTVDLLFSLFSFGSANFIKYRQQIWLDTMTDAIKEGSNIVFTFNPERTVDVQFPMVLNNAVAAVGGKVLFVQINCPHDEILARMNSPSRHECKKLVSPEYYSQLVNEGAFEYPEIPSSVCIDSSLVKANEAADIIIGKLIL